MSVHHRHSRRSFLKRAAATAAIGPVFAIAGTKASGQVLGANDRVRVAVAGVNGRGQSFLTGFGGMKDVEIAYIVDPDSRLFASRSKTVTEKAGYTPACIQDRALDDGSDAIAIVTPNHWHALMAIWACQWEGRLCQKPCCHNCSSRQLVEAARNRPSSMARNDELTPMDQLTRDIRNGKYGKLLVAHAFVPGDSATAS